MSLYGSFLTHQGRPTVKWSQYFPVYESHFGRYVNRPLTFWEIGVQDGGSLQLWKEYFGPYAKIIGLDIVDVSRVDEPQIHTRIAHQGDHDQVQAVLDEFGPPDIVLDDGSHQMGDILATFSQVYPQMSPSGVYMVEDLHCAYWDNFGGGFRKEGTFIEVAKGLVDHLNVQHHQGVEPGPFSEQTLSIHFYDSIVAFERGPHPRNESLHRYDGVTHVL